MPLDRKILTDMPPKTIFSVGESTDPRIAEIPTRWVAVRGGAISDWAIYFERGYRTDEYIAVFGHKLSDEKLIQELVPCDKDALSLYRK